MPELLPRAKKPCCPPETEPPDVELLGKIRRDTEPDVVADPEVEAFGVDIGVAWVGLAGEVRRSLDRSNLTPPLRRVSILPYISLHSSPQGDRLTLVVGNRGRSSSRGRRPPLQSRPGKVHRFGRGSAMQLREEAGADREAGIAGVIVICPRLLSSAVRGYPSLMPTHLVILPPTSLSTDSRLRLLSLLRLHLSSTLPRLTPPVPSPTSTYGNSQPFTTCRPCT